METPWVDPDPGGPGYDGESLVNECEALVERYLAPVEGDLHSAPLDDQDRLLIDTPYLHQDEDVVQVILERLGDKAVRLGDEGATLARLENFGVDVRSGKAAKEAQASLRAYRVDLVGDELRVEGPVDDTAEMFLRLIGAIRAIDGLTSLRTDPGAVRFDSRVITFLQSQFSEVRERPERIGTSGARYRLMAAVPREGQDVLIQAASGGRALTGRRGVEHAFRIFSDVNRQVPKAQKLVVLSSEEPEPRPVEDLRLLSRVSYVGAWDERDRVVEFLRGEPPG